MADEEAANALRARIRKAKNAARTIAADADVKGPRWEGYEHEMAGRRRIETEIRAMEAELERLTAP